MSEWPVRAVEDFADVQLGKMLDKAKNRGRFRPYLRNLNVRWFGFDLSDVLEMRVTDDEFNRYTIRDGDLVVCEGGYPGRGAIWNGEPVCYQKALHRVRCADPVTNRWLLYWLYFGDADGWLAGHFTGAGIQHFTRQAFLKLRVPLPPLAEQKRIVAILDTAFEGIDTAIANAEQNLANARALFEVRLRRLHQDRPDGWIETAIGDQFRLQRGYDITKKDQREGDVPVVSSGGISSHHDTAMAAGPGVVIGRKGSLGTVHYLEGAYWPHDTTLWVKDFCGNHPRYVYHFLRGLDVRGLDSGTANPSLNRNRIHPLATRWPSRELQDALVETLDGLEAATGELGAVYARKIAALAALRTALLSKAFIGGLSTVGAAVAEAAE